MFKAEKGITLVALIITIIVLLILAGVSISMVMQGDGLFSKASESVDKYKSAENAEQNYLYDATNTMNYYYDLYQ